MNLHVLHLDDALKQQSNFMQQCLAAGATETDAVATGQQIRLWGVDSVLSSFEDFLKQRFAHRHGTPITFYGSGDFHHVTGVLLPVILERQETPVTVIHFDNHPDWVHFDGGMHCGSWVNRALALPQVDRVITLGVCSKDLNLPECKGANLAALQAGKILLYPFWHAPSLVYKHYGSSDSYSQRGHKLHWSTLQGMSREEVLQRLLAQIRTSHVYITLDKDVLDTRDAITNWDQGQMRLDDVLWLIRNLAAQHGIVGIDVNGDYSVQEYAGTWLDKTKKRIEAALDQPRHVADAVTTLQRNSQSNLALLSLFTEIAA